MIKVHLNDEVVTLEKNNSLTELLEKKGLNEHYFAVAVNRNFISKSNYAATMLNEGDIVDVITPMQGG